MYQYILLLLLQLLQATKDLLPSYNPDIIEMWTTEQLRIRYWSMFFRFEKLKVVFPRNSKTQSRSHRGPNRTPSVIFRSTETATADVARPEHEDAPTDVPADFWRARIKKKTEKISSSLSADPYERERLRVGYTRTLLRLLRTEPVEARRLMLFTHARRVFAEGVQLPDILPGNTKLILSSHRPVGS